MSPIIEFLAQPQLIVVLLLAVIVMLGINYHIDARGFDERRIHPVLPCAWRGAQRISGASKTCSAKGPLDEQFLEFKHDTEQFMHIALLTKQYMQLTSDRQMEPQRQMEVLETLERLSFYLQTSQMALVGEICKQFIDKWGEEREQIAPLIRLNLELCLSDDATARKAAVSPILLREKLNSLHRLYDKAEAMNRRLSEMLGIHHTNLKEIQKEVESRLKTSAEEGIEVQSEADKRTVGNAKD